jgi:putative intracellular protease/amidase
MLPVLMVVSSRSRMDSGAPTGLWLEELAASYYVFADAGLEVVIASPEGGNPPVDALSLQEPWFTQSGRRFEADPLAQQRLRGSRRLSALNPSQYGGVFLVGGAAAAWDFPGNAPLAKLVAGLFAHGKPVAGVCHGVLGLTDAQDSNGAPIVSGRSVTGLSNAEEVLTGFDKLVPLLPETRLRALSANYSCAAPLTEYVVTDGNLLTGQNPVSAGPLARAVLQQLRPK